MTVDDLSSYLTPGEHLVWSGKPKRGLLFVPSDWFLVPFSLAWAWAATSAVMAGLKPDTPFLAKIFGAVFGAAGLYITVGRFLLDAWLRERILYAVTDRRILILRAGPFGKFTALGLDQLPALEFREGRNGRGTIRFAGPPHGGVSSMFGQRGVSSWVPALSAAPQFLAIEDARNAFTDIQNRAARTKT